MQDRYEITITFLTNNNHKKKINCYIAQSLKEKIIGLSDTDFLPKDYGMIFPFKYSNFRFFNMKDMKYPLDIIFIDKNYHIKKIYEADNNHNRLIYGYCKYVIETNKGFCRKNNILTDNTILLL